MSDRFDVNELLQQAMAVQERMQSAQADAAKQTVEGSAGGVTVKLTGTGELTDVTVAPGTFDGSDADSLTDAFSRALDDPLLHRYGIALTVLEIEVGVIDVPHLHTAQRMGHLSLGDSKTGERSCFL